MQIPFRCIAPQALLLPAERNPLQQALPRSLPVEPERDKPGGRRPQAKLRPLPAAKSAQRNAAVIFFPESGRIESLFHARRHIAAPPCNSGVTIHGRRSSRPAASSRFQNLYSSPGTPDGRGFLSSDKEPFRPKPGELQRTRRSMPEKGPASGCESRFLVQQALPNDRARCMRKKKE